MKVCTGRRFACILKIVQQLCDHLCCTRNSTTSRNIEPELSWTRMSKILVFVFEHIVQSTLRVVSYNSSFFPHSTGSKTCPMHRDILTDDASCKRMMLAFLTLTTTGCCKTNLAHNRITNEFKKPQKL